MARPGSVGLSEVHFPTVDEEGTEPSLIHEKRLKPVVQLHFELMAWSSSAEEKPLGGQSVPAAHTQGSPGADRKPQEGSTALLNFLADGGCKVARCKAQLCSPEAKSLGLIWKRTQRLREERIKPMLSFPQGKALKQVKGFLGMTGFFPLWIAEDGEIACPLIRL